MIFEIQKWNNRKKKFDEIQELNVSQIDIESKIIYVD